MSDPLHKNPISFNKAVIYTSIIAGLVLMTFLIWRSGLATGLLFACIPFVCLIIIAFIKKPIVAYLYLYVVNFLIMGIGRYVNLPIPPGVIVDISILMTLLFLFFHTLYGRIDWRRAIHPLFFLSLIWLLYCFVEALNPSSSVGQWATSVRSIAIYIFLFPILTSVICNRYKHLKIFLLVWAVLVLFAVLKAFVQKYHGFDSAELAWLTLSGGHTHLIHSGIRYFSFFTDAANFGCHMAFAFVVFSISAIYIKSTKLRVFFTIVSIAAIYGMMISGTRTAIIIPFVGFTCFVLIVRQWKWIIAGCAVLVATFMFFNFTYIGQENTSIRRMRTAFRFQQDASYQVRIDNQGKMAQFMGDYPFGLGLGSSKHAEEDGLLYNIATDSSLVYIWVETGIVGLILYLAILLFILILSIYYILRKLKHPELKGIVTAITAGYAGMLVAGYANEVLHQFPTGPTIYICLAFIMMSPLLDKELRNEG